MSLAFAAAASLCGTDALVGTANAATVRTFYVDPAGNDAAAGTSPTSAWKTLSRANRLAFQPGDRLLFKRGGTWWGRLLVNASGTATAPITIADYGTGNAPTFTGGTSGDCVRINGSYVTLTNLRATRCGYAGFNFYGDNDTLTNSESSNNSVGVKISTGSRLGRYSYNTLTDNNVMAVLTAGTDCGTPTARNCGDDSGAVGFLLNGDDNDLGFNAVSGSNAFSYDYGRDGSAFEVYNGNRNNVHDNVSTDNLVLSEIGRSSTGTANGNVYVRNTVTADCGEACEDAGGVTLRGAGSQYGPNDSTVIDDNVFRLTGGDTHGVVCHASCPSSTVVTNNTIAATLGIWMDGSGWTVFGNTVEAPSSVTLGPVSFRVLTSSRIV